MEVAHYGRGWLTIPGLRKITWLRFAGESFVIIASILLAFAIEAGWQNRLETRAQHLQLVALYEDFRENLAELEDREATVQSVVQDQLQLLALLRSAPAGVELHVPDSLVGALRSVGTIDPVQGTLDALIGSGRLDQVSNPSLRAALTDWPRLVSDVRTDQLEALQYMMRELIPYLATQGDYSQVFDTRGATNGVSMRPTPALLTMIAGKNVMDQWIVSDIAPLVEVTRSIHNLLEAELAR